MVRSLLFSGIVVLSACGGGAGKKDMAVDMADMAVDMTIDFNGNCLELGSPGGVVPVPAGAMLGDMGATDCDAICTQIAQGSGPSGSVNVHSCEFVSLDGGFAIDCVWSALQCI